MLTPMKMRNGRTEKPSFTTLGQDMSQGGKYAVGAPLHGLSDQMGQAGGYKQGAPTHGLGKQMGQR
jgi:hypothetical protein